jgi:hypothetical protein
MRGDCCSTVGAAVDRRGSATGRKAVIRKRLRKSRVSAPITESQFGCHGKCPRPASALAATKCRNPALRPNARQHHRASFQRRRGIPPAARAAGVSGSPRGGICVLPRLLLPGPLCRSGGLTRPQLRPEPCAMAALCRHTRSLQVVWRPSWIAAPTVWRIRRLQLSRERQRLAQPLVLDDRAARRRLDLVEYPERQRGTFVSDSKERAVGIASSRTRSAASLIASAYCHARAEFSHGTGLPLARGAVKAKAHTRRFRKSEASRDARPLAQNYW